MAISLGVSAVIAMVIIFIVGFGVYLNSTFDTTRTASTTDSTSNSLPTVPSLSTYESRSSVPCSTANSNGIQLTSSSYLFMNSSSAQICMLYTLTPNNGPLTLSFWGQTLIGHVSNGTQSLSNATSYSVSISPDKTTLTNANSTVEVTYTISGATGNVYFLPVGFCMFIPISHSANATASDLPFFPNLCPTVGISGEIVGLSNFSLSSLK